MKITFVKPVVTQNGGSRVVATYAKKLRAMGHEVTVVSRLPEVTSMWRRMINRFKKRVGPAHDVNRTSYFDDLGEHHRTVPWRFPLYADDVPDGDVVIATWWRTAFEVAALPDSKGKKVYFVQGHETFHRQGDIGAGSYYLPLEKIVISKWLEDIMLNEYQQDHVHKVPNAIDTTQFDAPKRGKNKTPTVGLIYAHKTIKGTDIALQALADVRKKYPDMKVVSFGAADVIPKLPLPQGSAFTKLPSQADISKLYAQCDVWVMASRTEGFGLPILEAMGSRTPVVSTRTGAAEDLIQDGVNGYVVEIDDISEMAQAIGRVLQTSNTEWCRMSQAAYDVAHGYTWDAAATRFESALMDIIAK